MDPCRVRRGGMEPHEVNRPGFRGGSVTWNQPTANLKGVTLTYWTATQTATMAKPVIAAFEKSTGAKIDTVVIPDVYETNAPTKLASGAKPYWEG